MDSPWVMVGLAGQAMFFSRFLVQWVASERQQRSTIPLPFWYLSLAGSALLLTYAIWRNDPVFILGQAFGSVVYIRNLVLIDRQRRTAGPQGAPPGPAPIAPEQDQTRGRALTQRS